MMLCGFRDLLLYGCLLINLYAGSACTSILVAKGAAAGGGTFSSHTDDCNNCDFRLSYVPAKQHEVGSKRALWPGREVYPRYIGTDRGETYRPDLVRKSSAGWKEGEGDFKVMATLPEVTSTYGYYDGNYGIMNEWGLAIGESTCGAVLTARSLAAGGKALVDVRELSRMAMERCRTARCAVKLMGSFAEAHGFFPEDTAPLDSGESLQVADGEEAWMFHILADDTGTSAVWVAKRVPDGHVAVVANQFVIRRLVLNDEDNFLFSTNIHEVAARAGLWHREVHGYPLDFTATFALDNGVLSPYSNRRVWRVFTIVAPSLASSLPENTSDFADDYPFSVPVDRPVSVQDMMAIKRDYYQGTRFDMSRGAASGPYGDIARFDPAGTDSLYPDGEAVTEDEAWSNGFDRAISIFRASYTWISHSRPKSPGLDLLWFGQYAPHASQYVPLYVKSGSVPDGFARGSLHEYDEASPYWVHALVGNWAGRFFRFVIGDIRSFQAKQEDALVGAQPQLEATAGGLLAAGQVTEAAALLSQHSAEAASSLLQAWHDFFKKIVAKYKDGQRLEDNFDSQYTLAPTKFFYPRSWLKEVHFLRAGSSSSKTGLAASGSGVAASHSAVAIGAALLGVAVGRFWAGTTHKSDDSNKEHLTEKLLIA